MDDDDKIPRAKVLRTFRPRRNADLKFGLSDPSVRPRSDYPDHQSHLLMSARSKVSSLSVSTDFLCFSIHSMASSSFNMAHLVDLLGYIGFFFSALVYISPAPTFYGLYKRRTPIERCSPIAYTLALFSASLWSYYGYIDLKWMVLGINALGCVLETLYMSLYIYYAPYNARPRVFRERDVGDMSFFLALSITMSGGFWCGYALLTRDIRIIISNGIGVVLGASQMAIYIVFKRPLMFSSRFSLTFIA
ncbi:Unknown protein [Striga hermonthica]|uniref:Bidirectional sugar transporter SWEET n=1 Tax=Striga hermonthica TaxID=68872 RepID=A0A9N7RJN1_STRHE|nr:Unknown protein [Striga hermonthica]